MEGIDFLDQADAGASLIDYVQASSVKKGSLIMLKGHPCKCVEYSTSKPGKHGAAKIHFIGIDIFTGKKHEEIISSTCNAE
jgi:translation initiation factor 5A